MLGFSGRVGFIGSIIGAVILLYVFKLITGRKSES
jgi:uncharacterized membrane protein YeaQ/YmgE (transglycosylase-associated protein family)